MIAALLKFQAGSRATSAHFILEVVGIALCAFAFGCAGPQKTKTEAAPSPVTVEAKQQQMSKLPAPDNEQVQQAIKRIFKDSVTVDGSQQPSFIAGDFNGDLSQDLAVIVKPSSGSLSDINEESPRWMIRDPFHSTEPTAPPLRVAENEILLAIIHGFGAEGWRDPQATQTYLLKNAVGSGLGVQAGKEFMAANTGKTLPRLHGDLISEVIRGTAGYLYFAGPTYSWYDPKTFKGESEVRVVHGRPPATKP
ncbi:MAG: hypothetical protein JWM21_1454 [Acidobacteria bacterium]|nr:hypothetical protein [Acidobacteriota bacterium]